MARIVSIFQFTGRAGSAVGSKGKGGKILLRQYQPTVANPRTDAQMAHRAKLKLAAQVAGMLGEVGRTSLIANGHRKTERGLLIKRLLKSIVVNADGSQATLQYDLHLVDNPSYAEAIAMQITSEQDAFVATFTGAASGEAIAKCIMVHDLTTGSWRHTAALDTRTAISLGKSANESGDALEVFAYGIVLEPKSSDAYSAIGQTAANQGGFVVDLNKVSTTNFAFSPTISAALTVGSNGSTSGGSGSATGGTTGDQTGTGGTGGSGSSGDSTQGSYVLTLAASPDDGGTLTASVNGTVVASGSQVPAGSEVRLTATPAEGKQLSGITMNSGSGNTAVQNSKFNMPAANTTVTATFTDATPGEGGNNEN